MLHRTMPMVKGLYTSNNEAMVQPRQIGVGNRMRKFMTAVSALLFGVQTSCAEPAGQQVKISDPHYSLTLPSGWVEETSDDAEMHSLHSKASNISLTISSIGMNAPPTATEQIAQKMIDFRLKAEEETAAKFGFKTTIAEPISVERPWGHAIAYYGSDSNGRHFSYSGIIVPTAVINVYVESPSAAEATIKQTLDTIMTSLSFDKRSIR